MDTLLLSRIQFGANISFHILFPTITIALGWVLLFFKLRFQWTGNEKWMDAYRFWVKVFALSFAMGVVSGITMSFQFGTNWPGFMETVGNIAGPLLAYEVMTAFFLEAVFLGIMLFGARRVPSWLHTTATFLVAFGTTMSAFWIIVLNSWMHTPVGFEMRDGVAHATDWLAIVFNPSMPYRLAHMLLASGLTVAFLVVGLSAYRWLRGDRGDANRAALVFGLVLGALLIPVQILMGDKHGLNTLKYQPQKVAAMEANWDTQGSVPLVLFGLPDEDARETHYEVAVPHIASVILTHTWDGVVPGLNDFVVQDGVVPGFEAMRADGIDIPTAAELGLSEGEVVHPPVAPVFFSFRIMVATGFAMLLVSWGALALMARRRQGLDGLPTWTFVAMVPMAGSGWLATLAGWYTTEIGRQPWLVQGVMTTEMAVADVPAPMVLTTLLGYLGVYAILLMAYIGTIFYLATKAARGEGTGPVRPGADHATVAVAAE
ncbi:MAG: cytochrome ubiquinol oxidase subunit I [Pseudomonadota bacterium]